MATSIKNTDFIKHLKNNNFPPGELIIKGLVVVDNSTNIEWNYIIFEGITFNDSFCINNVDLKSGLYFKNCTFSKGIIFKYIKSTDIRSDFNTSNASLFFDSCKGSHITLAENSYLIKGVTFLNSELKQVLIQDSVVINGGINITTSIIFDLLHVFKVKSDLKLRNSTLKRNFRVETIIGNMSLIDSTFDGVVKFWNIECPINITFNDNVFNDTVDFESARIIKGLFIHGDCFNKKFILENRDLTGNNFDSYCNEIYITEAKFLEGADFNGLGKSLETLTINMSPNLLGVITFTGWNIDSTRLYGINQSLKLLFKRIVFRHVFINEFSNYGDVSFDKCSANGDSVFSLHNSDLGTTRFNEFKFNAFIVIRIDNTQLDTIKASGVEWFEDSKLIIPVDGQTESEEYRRRREIYRQIKQALKSNGNQIDSLLFQAKEMKAFRNELKKGDNYSLNDRIIMSLNWTNNYGLAWLKPLVIIFIITFLFYALTLPMFSPKLNYTLAKNSNEVLLTLDELYNNFHVFWQMFNPTRRFSVVYGNINNGFLQFLDLIHRVLLGIFIYQIIRGFRKFVMK